MEQSSEHNNPPLFNRYIELVKNETDVNPCTGESKKITMVDIYIRDDSVDVMGWGWFNTFRPNNRTIDEIVETIMGVFCDDGFRVITDETTRPLPSQEIDSKHNMVRDSIEFVKQIPQIHPDTGQIREFAKLTMYQYDDRIELHSWGSASVTKPGTGQTVSEISVECVEALLNDGYTLVPRVSIADLPTANMKDQQVQDCLSLHDSAEPEDDLEI